ncbi:HAMP domain-containing sensor histidine kinase [Azospirillum sp. SYSU D00513]|uniref:sensor histidine kinase n=1 Tax=Azospirillum sp. SYSU D00513 TaxID=2812561 RepID=UPI001A965B4D|nr:HAMP domain-containing sensor histidine kinase [Azospirillum sp. SYSU D00513]
MPKSLSAKLLVLTVLFVMLAEVLIYTPSVARFRDSYLQERLARAHLAALSIEAAPDRAVTAELEAKLLAHVGARSVMVFHRDSCAVMLSSAMPPRVDEEYDLGAATPVGLIADAFTALFQPRDRIIRVSDRSPRDARLRVEVVMEERPMIAAMIDFSGRILALSIVISLITAGLVFLSLHRMLVRPLRRLTAAMVDFRLDPDGTAPIEPSPRHDEVGLAERELADMQGTLRTALRQRERLATLGTAVAKINHDLRGIFSTAALLSERLSESADPEVRRVTPRLMASLDRAAELCSQTLSYTQDGVLPVRAEPVRLRALAEEAGGEVLDTKHPNGARVEAIWDNRVPEDLTARVDASQLCRALVNLGRNAVQAGADRVTVSAEARGGRLLVRVADDGPGLPPRARDRLFQPFAGSARAGGVGLGLAIAREVLRAHGGDLTLEESTAEGTVFVMDVPDLGQVRPEDSMTRGG